MARPTKITPEQMEPYFDGLRLGMSQEKAAAAAAVGKSTVHRAERFEWFRDAEKKAGAECVQRRLQRLDRAGEGGAVISRRVTVRPDGTEVTEETFTRPEWTADAWVLERRFPDDFAKREPEEGVGRASQLRIVIEGAPATLGITETSGA